MFEALLSNRTVSVLVEALPRILTAGLTMTIPLTLVSFFFALSIAGVVAVVQYANVPVLRQIARFYIWVIRGTPLLVQLFIIFYGLPSLGIMLDAFPAAVIAFAFNEGAYCAETMRGALESVPQGQLEAGYCVGMTWWQIMRRIVLPQALRTAVPALSNSLIGMIKDTSLASNITVAELFMAGQRVAARTYIFLPIYCEVAVVYLLFCTVITKLQSLLEERGCTAKLTKDVVTEFLNYNLEYSLDAIYYSGAELLLFSDSADAEKANVYYNDPTEYSKGYRAWRVVMEADETAYNLYKDGKVLFAEGSGGYMMGRAAAQILRLLLEDQIPRVSGSLASQADGGKTFLCNPVVLRNVIETVEPEEQDTNSSRTAAVGIS